MTVRAHSQKVAVGVSDNWGVSRREGRWRARGRGEAECVSQSSAACEGPEMDGRPLQGVHSQKAGTCSMLAPPLMSLCSVDVLSREVKSRRPTPAFARLFLRGLRASVQGTLPTFSVSHKSPFGLIPPCSW